MYDSLGDKRICGLKREELEKKMKKSGLELKTRLNILSADNYGDFYDSVVVDYKFDSENNQLIDISDHCECYLF